jgi:PPOX class probable F420-dependent enzyme
MPQRGNMPWMHIEREKMGNKDKCFEKQKYLNLETFRKSGAGVKTPVWFVQDGEALFVRTGANSGKVKRIRNNGRVNIAPCKMNGGLLGDWVPAIAREVTDEEIDLKVDRLLDKKYGLLKKLFLGGGSSGRNYTLLEMKVSD